MKWTDKRDAQLRTMREAGLTFSQIAAALGVTGRAAIGRADRLGLAKQGQPAKRQRLGRVVRPPPAPQPVQKPESDGLVSLFDLQPHHCRWPVGEGSPYVFCAHTKLDDSSYCGEHFKMMRRPKNAAYG